MSLMNYLNDYVTGMSMRNNPKAQQAYFQQQQLEQQNQMKQDAVNNQRAYQEQQAKQWGQQANAVYGNQAQQGVASQYAGPQGNTKFGSMDLNVGVPMEAQPAPAIQGQAGQQATGVFQGASPEQARQYGLQKRAMETGQIPGMNMQLGAVNPMQTSSMANEQSGINNQANNANALQRQAMQNQQSGINNQANNQQRMQQAQMNSKMYQSANNPEAYKAFMDQEIRKKDSDKAGFNGPTEPGQIYNLPAGERMKQGNKLRDDYNKLDAGYRSAKSQWGRTLSTIEDKIDPNTGLIGGTGSGDIALINTFFKILDEGSIVRGSEFDQAAKSSGLIGNLKATLQGLKTGETLTDAQRTELVDQMNGLFKSAEKDSKGLQDQYAKLGKLYGIDERVFGFTSRDSDGELSIPTQGAPEGAQLALNKTVDAAQNALGSQFTSQLKDNGDGTFTLPDGRIVRKKQ